MAVTTHPRFGTATLALADGSRLDVATARAETYDRPGALPRVRAGTLADDLARRDFTINAMAVRLVPGVPRLEDPHGGRKDLARRRLRFLHAASARDDPTRAFRAALYANRLGFEIAAPTRRAIAAALAAGDFERISADRRRREIARLLSEGSLPGAVRRLDRLGLLPAVGAGLSARHDVLRRLARAEGERRSGAPTDEAWFSALLVWAADLSDAEAASLARRLNLPRRRARALARRREAGGDALRVRGRDLVAAGIPPGPAIGRALAATREARRAGRIEEAEELAFALSRARAEKAS